MFQPIQNNLSVLEMISNVSFYFLRIDRNANRTEMEREKGKNYGLKFPEGN